MTNHFGIFNIFERTVVQLKDNVCLISRTTVLTKRLLLYSIPFKVYIVENNFIKKRYALFAEILITFAIDILVHTNNTKTFILYTIIFLNLTVVELS